MEKEGRTKRVSESGRDWTKGSIIQNLLMLSWPIMISQFLNMIGPTIDMIWVGKLGAAPIAGVGVGGMVVMFMTSATMGLGIGTRAIIARFMGAGDNEGANHAARQAFFTGACFAATMMAIGIYFTEPILMLLGVGADVVAEGAGYMRIMFVCSAAMTFRMLTEGIMQSSGDTVTPMRISILFRAFHTALCPFLVFGLWIFPRLGVKGAALTNIFSQSLGLGLGIWIISTGRTRLRLTLSNFRLDTNIIWRIVRIGIPATVMAMQRNFLQLLMMKFMIPFGTVAVAAHILTQRLDMAMFPLIMGLGMGSGVLAGQNLGAGQPERAERTGWLALSIAQCIMIFASAAILLWAENIISIFNTEPDLMNLAASFLRIATVGYMVLAFIGILNNFLSGAGDTLPPMFIGLGYMWLVIVPLAFLLPGFSSLGMWGIRWAIVIGMIVGATAMLIYFKSGRWKSKRV
ncbi:MAG: MATE family efflux transporter [Deltaproteobacteria bacterium]|nr:MATE family efflux transporter [Deltaproteobacteria bacterium]